LYSIVYVINGSILFMNTSVMNTSVMFIMCQFYIWNMIV
jgi:hypothetical protein